MKSHFRASSYLQQVPSLNSPIGFSSDLVMFVLAAALHHSSYTIKTTMYSLAYGMVDK